VPYDRVALVMKAYLGDAVMATPLLDELERMGLEPCIFSSPTVLQMLESPERRFEAVVLPGGGKLRGMFGLAREMRARQIGTAILINRSFRSAVSAYLSGAHVRVGHSTDGRSFLLTDSTPYGQLDYEAASNLEMGVLAGFECALREPSLFVSEEEKASVAARLEGADVGVQPGNRHVERQIPVEALAEAARALMNRGHRIVMLGGAEERPAGEALAARLDPAPVDLVGMLKIRESMAALANLRLMVGGVAGLMHVAVGVGCPTVWAFGANPTAKWAHRFGAHRYIEAGDVRTLSGERLAAECLAAIGSEVPASR